MRSIVVVLLVTSLFLPTVLAAPRTETAGYLNPSIVSCGTPAVPGNACFRVRTGDTTIQISVADEINEPGLGIVSFVGAGNIEISRVNFCRTSAVLPIPAGAVTVRVQFYLDALAASGCPGQAVRGTATAVFG